LHLPASQLRLLLHLYQHRGEVRSRASCAEAIWGRPYDPVTDDGALDKVVSKLRRRLAEADPAAAAWVRNRRGVGYSLEW
jgi:DNA-binding response OmpR family regulator